MSDAFAAATAAASGGHPTFVAVIQNFRASGGHQVLACGPDLQTATAALLSSGQRHPGWVLSILAARAGPPGWEAPVLGAVEFAIGDAMVLVARPVPPVASRCELHWVGHRADEGARALERLTGAALLGEVLLIADGEMGCFDRYRQAGRNALGTGH